MLHEATDILKELEYAERGALPMLFKYRIKCNEETSEDALEVGNKFREELTDPGRIVAQHEKLLAIRKSVGRKKKIVDHFKRVLAGGEDPIKSASLKTN